MNKSARPVMYQYRTTQAYLADLIHWLKSQGTSLRAIALRLKISPALLSLITKGKRSLTVENVELWKDAFHWDEKEVAWLKQMIAFESKDTGNKKRALSALSRSQNFRSGSESSLMFKYLKRWWNVAIREMSELPDFSEDPNWIREHLIFPVPLPEIRSSLKFLNKHGLLAKHGKLRSLNCDSDVYKLSLSEFHDQILRKAVDSIYKVPSEERSILGHTMTIPSEKISDAKLILEEALRKISALHSTEEADRVYHFSFLTFPLTTKENV